jgi:hypothetical protein
MAGESGTTPSSIACRVVEARPGLVVTHVRANVLLAAMSLSDSAASRRSKPVSNVFTRGNLGTLSPETSTDGIRVWREKHPAQEAA